LPSHYQKAARKGVILIIFAVLLLSGAVYLLVIQAPEKEKSTSAEINFREIGNIVNWDSASGTHTDSWHLVYEEPGAPPPPPKGFTIPVIDLADQTHRQIVVDREEGQYLGHPSTVLLEDQKTIICVFPKGHGKGVIVMKKSSDGGITWSEPRELPGALTGDRHTGKYAPDGRLLISFRDTALETPTQGDWVAWVGTYEDIVKGKEGQYRVRLMDNKHNWDCAYPGVEVLPDGTFVLVTYGHWVEGEMPFVMCVRLTLEELDEMVRERKIW